ncbi:MAG: hypothetical protein Q8J78_14865 [Moraxellaceae bacterium]|nr:hypothetical protein [Moraxellaceae bacterium]
MSSWKAAASLMLCLASPLAQADIAPASAADMKWFEGRWATVPADVPGMETLAPATADCTHAVTLRQTGASTLMRVSTLRNGEAHTAEFEIKTFAGNYPWWPLDDGPAPVAKRIGDNAFVLARTQMGRADWANALQHIRCPD